MCRAHFRLYEMAVIQEYQGCGYGRAMLIRIKKLCLEKGVETITLRTNKQERAIDFWLNCGGKIVGEKQGDYEVEIKV